MGKLTQKNVLPPQLSAFEKANMNLSLVPLGGGRKKKKNPKDEQHKKDEKSLRTQRTVLPHKDDVRFM